MQKRLFSAIWFCGLWAAWAVQPAHALVHDYDVVCIGDSITAGYAVSVSYPTRLANNTGLSVGNAGVGGQTAGKGVTRINGLLTDYDPESVLILYGTNDINMNHNLWDAANSVLEIALRARNYGAFPVIGTVPPMVGPASSKMPQVRELNGYLRSLASANGIALADIQAAFGSGSGLMVSDGFHPNDAGAELIAKTFAAKIPILIKRPSTVQIPDTGALNQTFSILARVYWTATANQSWIHVVSGASGSGNGTVTLNVDVNTGLARTGTVSVAGGGITQKITVKQDAATLSVYPSGSLLPSAGATGCQFAVTAHLPWTAIANQPWIHITSGTPGVGNGTVIYSVDANVNTSRTGTIIVSVGDTARIYNVNQYPPPAVPGVSADGDFDGDGTADLVTYQPSTGNWNLWLANGIQWTYCWGWSEAIPVPADYDGDGIVDIAVYHPATGKWYIHPSGGGADREEMFGWSASIPLPGDYDGDGKADLAVYYRPWGRWYFRYSGGAPDYDLAYGWSAAIPVPADYDGDGQTDLAVYNPSTGIWYIFESLNLVGREVKLGGGKALPVPADYDSDGKADIAVFTRSNATWKIQYNAGSSLTTVYGWSAIIPVPADYDGDGATDITVYHPSWGNWYIHPSGGGLDREEPFGGTGKNPVLLNYLIHSWFKML